MRDPSKTLLIVPGGYGDAPERRRMAADLGLRVVGASSVEADPAAADYDAFAALPHISDPGFAQALGALIAAEDIGRIHASHYALWFHLDRLLPTLAPHVGLSRGRTNFDLEAEYRDLRRTVEQAPTIPELDQASAPREALSAVEAAGMLRAALSIPGESYGDKLLAMIQAMRRAPAGDVVEVGSLFGRTAALLALLARRYAIGAVLCVDPWSRAELDQGEAAAILLEPSLGYDWDQWRLIFEINVAPFAAGRLNYIQAPSVAGAAAYAASRTQTTAAFGDTLYVGGIALLHLDGNHAFDHIAADTAAWAPHVLPGGWIIFDDYVWDWGDGPRRVADAFVADPANGVRTAFVAGGALFVQLMG